MCLTELDKGSISSGGQKLQCLINGFDGLVVFCDLGLKGSGVLVLSGADSFLEGLGISEFTLLLGEGLLKTNSSVLEVLDVNIMSGNIILVLMDLVEVI